MFSVLCEACGASGVTQVFCTYIVGMIGVVCMPDAGNCRPDAGSMWVICRYAVGMLYHAGAL